MLAKNLFSKISPFLGITFITLLLLTACTSGSDTPAAGTGTGGITPPAGSDALYLTSSTSSIQSDDAQSATITATVVEDFIPQEGVEVIFSTDGGFMTPRSATTGDDGKATTTLTSGLAAVNSVVTITGTSLGLTNTVPVQISGNVITLTADQTNIGIGDASNISVSLKNAIPVAIPNAPVTFTFLSGAAFASLSASQATTDVLGEAAFTVTGIAAGIAVIQASGMGTSTLLTINVTIPSAVFEITSPTATAVSLSTAVSQTVTVNAPSQLKVTFVTTLGEWNSIPPAQSVDVDVAGGTASLDLTSTTAGTASIVVMDEADVTINDTLQVTFSAPPVAAAAIDLQASNTNVTISTGSTTNSVTLYATVTTGGTPSNVVGGAIVNFSMSNNPGGGEYISPASAVTNDFGVATATFHSGSLTSSGGTDGVTITATVDQTAISDTENIIIGGLAGSIVIGRSNEITTNGASTAYTQQITIQATDANGSPMANQDVSLSLWPTHYYLGYDYGSIANHGQCGATIGCYKYVENPDTLAYATVNEDTNNNLILDPGEDLGPYAGGGTMTADGLLTPHNAAAGSVPQTITTEADGTATFNHTFLMQYALWVTVELKATIVVAGTETQATETWILPGEETDINQCDLFDSPFGYYLDLCLVTACNDGIDNDGDGGIDFGGDPECASAVDTDESS